ncbi:MAG: hypothetical protein NXI04_19695 [Planctomycetaceae bacterium]|nr:hypothetical protein [Planctomycetaceae bacterium]
MLPYERNLMISLCLGLRLDGSESPQQLEHQVAERSTAGDLVSVQPLQRELADWLHVSLEDARNQQTASILLWEQIETRGYGLVDVPLKIRRTAFGGSVEIQKRHARAARSTLSGLGKRVLLLLLLVGLAVAGWFLWTSVR